VYRRQEPRSRSPAPAALFDEDDMVIVSTATASTLLYSAATAAAATPLRKKSQRRSRKKARRTATQSRPPAKKRRKKKASPVNPNKSSGACDYHMDGTRKVCGSCGTNHTPYWRDGFGVCLCNACGIRFKKRKTACTSCHYVPRKDERSSSCARCDGGTYEYVRSAFCLSVSLKLGSHSFVFFFFFFFFFYNLAACCNEQQPNMYKQTPNDI
jgi:hypothetical protein